MQVEVLVRHLNADFFAGVPDSQLKALCGYLVNRYGIDPKHHVISANEGNCAAVAAGYHLATGKVPVVYLQNSGEGNLINPLASLLNRRVYAIPMLFIVGWRGEPGVHDEPQHIYQGQVTRTLLDDMEVPSFVLSRDTAEAELAEALEGFRPLLAQGGQAAIVVRKGALEYEGKAAYAGLSPLNREEIIRHIVRAAGNDPIVSTTGKASRELFELRTAGGQGHGHDFLTVGSMGHSSSIALGIAAQKPETRVWCIDGDGAALMHLGAMAVIGAAGPRNLIHVVINNGAHETVGGMPTVAGQIDLAGVARACGYPHVLRAETYPALDDALAAARARNELAFLEVRCGLGARADLGRPTTTALQNKEAFMEYLSAL